MQALFDVGKQVATIKNYRSAISAVLKGFEARHQKIYIQTHQRNGQQRTKGQMVSATMGQFF